MTTPSPTTTIAGLDAWLSGPDPARLDGGFPDDLVSRLLAAAAKGATAHSTNVGLARGTGRWPTGVKALSQVPERSESHGC